MLRSNACVVSVISAALFIFLLFAEYGATFCNAVETPAKLAVAEIQVLDTESGRPVPLVELETVNHEVWITDNAGRAAIHDPALFGRSTYFWVRSHGYEYPADGFGNRGVALTLRIDQPQIIKLPRKNLAERCCRLTGASRYRDSQLLGSKLPEHLTSDQGQVLGQDSIQAVRFQNRVHWFWGDTQRGSYPLGLFRTAGAVTDWTTLEQESPERGIPYRYYTNEQGFARAMMPLAERSQGVIWIDGLCVVENQILAHYSRRKDLGTELEHGIAKYDVEQAQFVSLKQLDANEKWRFPATHPIPWTDQQQEWLLFGSPTPNVRVPAKVAALLDPTQYQAFTCAEMKQDQLKVQLDTQGEPNWRWQQQLPPVDSKTAARWVKEHVLTVTQARFCPSVAGSADQQIMLHNGTVRWNAHRQRWILLAGQLQGKASFLGEIWYAEARQPTGPFTTAVQVLTHDRQTFYNLCQHDFLDREQGRVIYFEGTYTSDFSGNPVKTPRYDYNQLLYRLDLALPALQAAHAK